MHENHDSDRDQHTLFLVKVLISMEEGEIRLFTDLYPTIYVDKANKIGRSMHPF
jgi:hypothetical protein